MREVWNRAQGALTQEPEVGAGAMHFVYGTAFGRLLARGILCRRFFTSSPEHGADRVCRRIPHRDPHRHR